jgi:hypothetical protein
MSMENFIGRKAKKAWAMRPKERAGRPATGNGEWRAMRRAKVKTEPVKKKKSGRDGGRGDR